MAFAPNYLRYVWSLAFRQRRMLVASFTLLLLGVIARLIEPYLYKVVVDTLTNGIVRGEFFSSDTRILVLSVVVWFLLAVITNIANAEGSHLVWKIGNQNSHTVQMAGYRRILRLDYAKYTQQHSSRFTKIVDDADTAVWEMTNWWLGRFSSAILGFAGMLVIAFSVSWPMTLVAVAIIPPSLWFIMRYVKKCREDQRHVNKLWEATFEHLTDQLTNLITYKLNPREGLFLKRHEDFVLRARDAQLALNKKWKITEVMNPDALARFMVLGFGIFLVAEGSITLGTLFMFMGFLQEILTPLHVFRDILPQYSRRAQHIERYLDLLAAEDTIVNPALPVPVSAIRGEVVFDHLWFSYGGESDFGLKNISFRADPGHVVAIVGHSGSGKTTLMTLLNRLMDPDKGRILIDGVDLREYDLEAVKRHIGTVLQENAMYNETAAENIAYGNPDATTEEIIRAATQSRANEFIEKLPKKYDTVIGEKGIRLSGGEKQRIAIARAILKNPSVVILDEPTSALDSITEAKVQKGLNELMKGRTTIVIAHRLSTVRNADIILVLEKGKIICQGPHRQLVKTCKVYRMMVDLQIKGFLADSE